MREAVRIILIFFIGSIMVGLLSYSVIYELFYIAPQENSARVLKGVTAVCNTDSNSKQCIDIQNVTNTEYLCDEVTCWSEDK